MTDLEKVIKGLKAHGYADCKYCPYWGTGLVDYLNVSNLQEMLLPY